MRSILLGALFLTPWVSTAEAQPTAVARVDVSLQGLLSWHPVRGDIEGPPYIDRGLGGVGPGFALGADVTARWFALEVEHSRAWVRVTQTGRRAGGMSTGALHDPLVTLLGGVTFASPARASLTITAGLSLVGAQPEQDGVPVRDWDGVSGRTGSVGPAIGVRYSQDREARLGWTMTVRYSHLPRSADAKAIGVGSHVLRFGAGIRVRLR